MAGKTHTITHSVKLNQCVSGGLAGTSISLNLSFGYFKYQAATSLNPNSKFHVKLLKKSIKQFHKDICRGYRCIKSTVENHRLHGFG